MSTVSRSRKNARLAQDPTEALDALLDAIDGSTIIEPRDVNRNGDLVRCDRKAVVLNKTEGFVVTYIDENGVESFERLVSADEGEWDATDEAAHFTRTENRRVYEIAAVILTGRELPSEWPTEAKKRARGKAVAV